MDATVSPVKLKYALSQSLENSGIPIAYTYIKVKVQKFVQAKAVEFIYKNSDGKWHVQPLSLENDFGNYSVFGLSDAPYAEEFALQYTIDDVPYWDSNHGVNYKLPNNNNTIGGNVMLKQVMTKTEVEEQAGQLYKKVWLEGEIFIRKISYSKKVGIRLSRDDGQTWEEIDATYKGVEIEGAYSPIFNPAVEVWKFQTPSYNYDDCADKLRFVVYYKNEETAEWYWDNNFEQDYKLSKVNGSTIE